MWNTIQPMTLVCCARPVKAAAGRISRTTAEVESAIQVGNGRQRDLWCMSARPGGPIAPASNWPMCKAADRLALGALALVAVLACRRSDGRRRQPMPSLADARPADEALRRLFTPATFPPARSPCIGAMNGSKACRPAEGARSCAGGGRLAGRPRRRLRRVRGRRALRQAAPRALFGGSSPSVARGTLVTAAGRPGVHACSRLAPTQSLSSLRPGTMVIVTKLPSRESSSTAGGSGRETRQRAAGRAAR